MREADTSGGKSQYGNGGAGDEPPSTSRLSRTGDPWRAVSRLYVDPEEILGDPHISHR
jgi:hypothetical protein